MLKELLAKLLEILAYKTVNGAGLIFIYQPKVPSALQKQVLKKPSS